MCLDMRHSFVCTIVENNVKFHLLLSVSVGTHWPLNYFYRSKAKLELDVWHKVTMERRNKDGTLDVDGQITKGRSQASTHRLSSNFITLGHSNVCNTYSN